MRKWLEERVLPGARGRRRCFNPSRSFPGWLADARLHADGSTITTVKSRAVRVSTELDGGARMNGWEKNSKGAWLELHSVIGRMLWREAWGGYMEGVGWWWEDQECVEECRRMGTYWEYGVVEAVKER